MSRHRADVPLRPRYGRIAVLTASLLTTGVAVLGGIGVLPSQADGGAARLSAHEPASEAAPVVDHDAAPAPETLTPGAPSQRLVAPDDESLPAGSGSGRRAVFSESRQRVWLVDGDAGHETVLRTYPVSGSVTGNLPTGSYRVYSRSLHAVGVDDSGTMRYFVRFTEGPQGAAIGFHDIPVKDDHLVQTAAQLGTPQSHGCIRQQRKDAEAMWHFAGIGTSVVVTE